MQYRLMALIAGLVFGFGLLLSGLSNPAKVQAFLDVAGQWDPSLALVMGSAVSITLLAFLLLKKQRHNLLGGPLQWPAASGIDGKLLSGSALFGIGWGIAGFCPGPAIVAVATGTAPALLFAASMLAGMALFPVYQRLTR